MTFYRSEAETPYFQTWLKRSLLPDLVEEVHEGVIDHEGNSHVEAHPGEAGHRAFVEPAEEWGAVIGGNSFSYKVYPIFAHRSNICCPRDLRLSA